MSLINQKVPTENFQFQYIPLSPSDGDACKMPQGESWSKFLSEHKNVILTGAPAAFSPTCSINHIPGYIKDLKKLEAKGVDQVVVITVDNPFANAAWAKSLGVNDTSHIKFVSDAGGHFVKRLGFELPVGEGVNWSTRWAAVVKDGVVTYADKESNPAAECTVTDVSNIEKHL